MTSLLCDTFIAVSASFGFSITKAQLDLIDHLSNTLINRRPLHARSTGKYPTEQIMFVNRTTAFNATLSSGAIPISIPPSPKYALTVTVSGAVQNAFTFELERACTRL